MNPIWFLRMKRWAQNPPSARRIVLVFGVIGICLALYGLERAGVLPDWMQADRAAPRPLR